MMNKDDLDKNLDRINDWIKAADQKVGILLASEGVILTLSFSSLATWLSSIIEDGHFLSVVGGISSIVILLSSIYKAGSAIIPRLKHGGTKSVLFFADIASMKPQAFQDEVENMSEKKHREQLTKQVHEISKIATSKHQGLRDSMLTLLLAMTTLMATYVIHYYGY